MAELLPHQKKIAEKRYFQLDETAWEHMVNRRVFPTVMADELKQQAESGWTDERLEAITRESRELLNERVFLFNTPTWINAGMPGARTLSACFVGELKDDMLGEGGILDCSRWFGTVQKFGGGTGIDLSALRPQGSPIKSTHGKACGPLMVLKYLAATSQMITQGGARDGANMAVMSVYHEDIVEFIKCKSTESKYLLELPREIAQAKVYAGEWTIEAGQVYVDYCKKMGVYQLFNMSVAVDNKFMSAAQDLAGDRTEHGTGRRGYDESKSYHEVLPCGLTIQAIWDLMVEQSHSSGDPGILFMERAQEFARFHSTHIPSATNPCVAAGTLVATPDGWERVELIVSGDEINTVLGRGRVRDIECHDNYPVYRVKFSDGHEQIVTVAHQYHVRDSSTKFFKPKRLDQCKLGELVRVFRSYLPNSMAHTRPQPVQSDRDFGFMIGCMIGDGCWTPSGDKNNVAKLAVNASDGAWIHKVKKVFRENGYPWASFDQSSKDSNSANLTSQSKNGVVAFMRQTRVKPAHSHEKRIPLEYINCKQDFIVGLLDGLYSTNGNINLKFNHPQIRYKTSSKELAKDLRLILLAIGCHPTIFKTERVGQQIEGREVTNRPVWEVTLSGQSVGTFLNQVDITHPLKAIQVQQARLYCNFTGNNWVTKIVSIEPAGVATVYDLYEPVSDTWITEGYVQRGCGEQFLPEHGSCNLGSIDLAKFVDNNFDDTDWERRVSWAELARAIELSVRMLDNVVSINKHPVDKIGAMNEQERRIGLGVMGWADVLVKLKVPYDSEQAIEIAKSFAQFFKDKAHQASVELAEERGAFPLCEIVLQQTKQTPLDLAKIAMSYDEQVMPFAPRRNSTVTTVAPTGTISLMAGCSSGIEPHFLLCYEHDGLAEHGGLGYIWASETLREMYEQDTSIGVDGFEDYLRRVFGWKPANEISIDYHVRHQAAWQMHIDNSISKCIAKGTLIPTNQGLIRIEDFSDVQDDDTFVELDGSITTATGKITQHYKAGVKDSITIRLDNGSELTGATASHKVMTLDGWRLMSKLQPGDYVVGDFCEHHSVGREDISFDEVFRTNAKQIKIPTAMSPELAEWLGMMAADGHTCESIGQSGITQKDLSVEANFETLSEKLFGVKPERRVDPRNKVVSNFITSRVLVRWVEKLIGKGAYNKHTPDQILQGSSEEKRAFLRGLTLDGYFIPQRGLVVYGGMSKQLAYEAAEIARSFGLPLVSVDSKEVKSASVTGARCYCVLVSNEMQDEVVPIETHKNQPAYYRAYRVGIYPDIVKKRFDSISTDHPFYSSARHLKSTNAKFCYNTTACGLGITSGRPVFRVESVRWSGPIEMYDIEVETSHAYLANGIISHNTLNLPHSATKFQVAQTFLLSYSLGCKGSTVYRDGCKPFQPLNAPKVSQEEIEPSEAVKAATKGDWVKGPADKVNDLKWQADQLALIEQCETFVKDNPMPAPPTQVVTPGERIRKKREEIVHGVTIKVKTSDGSLYVTINRGIRDEPFEVFATVGKAGGKAAAYTEAIGRLMSTMLQYNIPIEEIKKELRGISAGDPVGMGPSRVLSVPDGIGKAIEQFLEYESEEADEVEEIESAPLVPAPEYSLVDACPECGASLFKGEGCSGGMCRICGYAKCQ